MLKIRTYNNIAEKGLQRFSADNYAVSADLPDAAAILLRSEKLSSEIVTS